MKCLTLSELSGHDVYELCYWFDEENPTHWSETSLYVTDGDILELQRFIDAVIGNFHYYGPQRVSVADWEKIKNLCLSDKGEKEFFEVIDAWIAKAPYKISGFWILGI